MRKDFEVRGKMAKQHEKRSPECGNLGCVLGRAEDLSSRLFDKQLFLTLTLQSKY